MYKNVSIIEFMLKTLFNVDAVCETIFQKFEVQDDEEICEDVVQTECILINGVEQCDDVPRRSCRIETRMNTKTLPKSECRPEIREVCGPEPCPIVKADKICRTEETEVRNGKVAWFERKITDFSFR